MRYNLGPSRSVNHQIFHCCVCCSAFSFPHRTPCFLLVQIRALVSWDKVCQLSVCVWSEWKLLQSSPFSERALRQEHKSLKYVLSQLLHHLKIVRLVPTRQIAQLGGHKQKSKACISNAPEFVCFHDEPSAPSSTYVMVLEESLLSLLPQINVTQPGKVLYVEGCGKGEDIFWLFGLDCSQFSQLHNKRQVLRVLIAPAAQVTCHLGIKYLKKVKTYEVVKGNRNKVKSLSHDTRWAGRTHILRSLDSILAEKAYCVVFCLWEFSINCKNY